MIVRLYVDNFRTLLDFTWRPGAECLLLGYNGSGKTTVLDAIDLIRSWAFGWQRLSDLITRERLTRWGKWEVVRFELDISTEIGMFQYRVEFICPLRYENTFVRSENLRLNEDLVFDRKESEVIVQNGGEGVVGQFSLPNTQSALGSVAASNNASLTNRFLTMLARMIVVRPMPPRMHPESREATGRVMPYFENFIGWYQYWAQQQRFSRAWNGLLNEVWEDFDYLELESVGRQSTALNAVFRKHHHAEDEFKLDFNELSEGERMLIVLYALLAYQVAQPPTTLLIDEPDNFVSIAELQPWLLSLLDSRPEKGQVVLVSHNAEIIQTMGPGAVSYLYREDHAFPTEVRSLPVDESGLSLAELLKLGWIDPVKLG